MRLGVYVYGFATVAAGIFDVVWGDFDTSHQPIRAFGDHISGRELFAYITAVWMIAGGVADGRHLFHLCHLLVSSILYSASLPWCSTFGLYRRLGWSSYLLLLPL